MELVRALTEGLNLYDCGTCRQSPHLYAALGHDGPGTLYPTNLVTGAPLAECPRRTVDRAAAADPRTAREAARLRDTYLPLFEAGHLPSAAGGVDEQSARTMAALQRLTRHRAQMQTKYDELRPKDAAGGANG